MKLSVSPSLLAEVIIWEIPREQLAGPNIRGISFRPVEKITGRGGVSRGSDDAKLVQGTPRVSLTTSFAGCPIVARDLLPEANIHAYTLGEASMPS